MGKVKYTEERIVQDIRFIYDTYGDLTNKSIVDSNKKFGTCPLGVFERKCRNKDTMYSLIGVTQEKNTFKKWCIENNKMDFLDCWDYELNQDSPEELTYGSHQYRYFKCKECNHSQQYFIKSLTGGVNLHCEYCNSFEKWCIDNNKQNLLDRWDYEKNELSPSTHPKGSNKHVWLKCERGIHDSEKHLPHSIIGGLTNSECRKCNSFAQWGIERHGKEFLEMFWSEELNDVDPWEISNGTTNANIWLKCQNTDYHGFYETTPHKATRGEKITCPYCYTKSLHYLDSLGSACPEVLELWSDKNDLTPFDYKPQSSKKAWFKCKEQKHDDTLRIIANAYRNNFDCPDCVARRSVSKIEEIVKSFINNELHYLTNHENKCSIVPINPKTNYPLPFDNEIEELKLIIEVHGSQHYQKNNLFNTHRYIGIEIDDEFEYLKWKDEFKRNYALEHGYFYLEIPYWTVTTEGYKKLIIDKINEIKTKEEIDG